MIIKSFLGFLAAVAGFLTPPLAAEPGDLDLTFNGTGKVRIQPASQIVHHASAVAVQRDGKIVVAGYEGDGDPPGEQ